MIDRDKAIQTAKEAELPYCVYKDGETYFDGVEVEQLQALLNRVRNEALEGAALACEKVNLEYGEHPEMALTCAQRIRALNQE